MAGSLLCLASFTLHNAFESHPHCSCVRSSVLFWLSRTPLYRSTTIYLLRTFGLFQVSVIINKAVIIIYT